MARISGSAQHDQPARPPRADRRRKQDTRAHRRAAALRMPRAIGARDEDQHARQARQARDQQHVEDRPRRRERAQFGGAGMTDHGDVDQVHQRPVEAGQDHRPGEAGKAADLRHGFGDGGRHDGAIAEA